MAKAIAPNGTLYAEDIDKDLLAYVADKAQKEGVTNIRTVLGVYYDPKLPVRNVDVAFFHRVLHMIEHRQLFLNNTAPYLKSDGRIVIIDKNPEDSPNSWMWLRQSDVDTWMAALSFYPAENTAFSTTSISSLTSALMAIASCSRNGQHRPQRDNHPTGDHLADAS